MAEEKNFSPMMVQTPNGNKIECKDCIHRDKTVITINKKTIPIGITKGNCDMFIYPDNKPSEVLFQNAKCEYYEKE